MKVGIFWGFGVGKGGKGGKERRRGYMVAWDGRRHR